MKSADGRVGRIVLATTALLVALALVTWRLVHHRAERERDFASVCVGIHRGDAIASSERAFLVIGERRSGSGGAVGAPPSTHHWFRRSGLSRHQQCTVEVDPGSQDVVDVRLDAGTDFADCRDPISYPHRHLLCAIADTLAL